METNESILTREIVSIDDRKRLGKLKDLCVDCDTCAVNHYIVTSATTNASLVLPFDKSLAVGDTFMTIQSREDFMSSADEKANEAISEGFRLIGSEVFSRTGNRLGVVESYEFDPTYGLITKINLGKRSSFSAESFVFFSPDFVFVDDGEATAQETRTGSKGKKKAVAKAPSKPARKSASKSAAPKAEAVEVSVKKESISEGEKVAEAPKAVVEASKAVVEKVVEAPKAVVEEVAEVEEPEAAEELSVDEDAVLKDFLLDAIVSEDVISKDGAFEVSKGTKLTKELIDKAQKHDALLLLTMSVEA